MVITLPSCADIIQKEEDNPREFNGNCTLSLMVELPSIGESRAMDDWEDYENYIDASNLHVLFFKCPGYSEEKIKESEIKLLREFTLNDKMSLIPIEAASHNSRKWNLRISLDNTDLDLIKLIKEIDFKIVILANWEGYEKDKVLNEGDEIYKLHHLQEDLSYKGVNFEDKSVYSFLDSEFKLGLKSEWAGIYSEEKVLKGKELASNKLIPMYGVQGFKALGEFWEDGEFDLSNFNNTTPSGYKEFVKAISLLKSVAKVELFIPKSMGAHHVYLRNMNRFSRYEPADVISDTGSLWKDSSTGECVDNCELNTLRGQVPFYNIFGNLQSYQSALKWWYGRLLEVKELEGVNSDEPNKASPYIFNPVIDMVDCVEFIKTESDEENYDRYILYVPEKFVDDPSEAGDPKSSPKVCHIEFRDKYDLKEDIDINDNNCYRLYFIEDGVAKDAKLPDFMKGETWESEYEQNVETLKKHWPIVRNHLYQFRVKE